MKTIIAGSRDITSYAAVEAAAAAAPWDITEVVSGGARGVDRLGERVAEVHGLPVTRFNPDWINLGSYAGIKRNEDMGLYADALVAVWDGSSRGTRHMIDFARQRGLLVHVEIVAQG